MKGWYECGDIGQVSSPYGGRLRPSGVSMPQTQTLRLQPAGTAREMREQFDVCKGTASGIRVMGWQPRQILIDKCM